MHLLFTLTYYTPYVSGLTIYVRRIAKSLAGRDFQVSILTSQHDGNLPKVEMIDNVKVIRVPYLFKISKGFVMPTYFFEAFKAVKAGEAVFINLPQAEGFVAAIIAKLLQKKLYCIYHCDLILPKGILNFFINKLVLFFNSVSLRLADKIIVYTNEYAETSSNLNKYKNKFIQIFPPVNKLPVDEKYFQGLKQEFSGREFKLGFAARVAEEKGLEYLISAIQSMNDVKLFIAGPKEGVAGEEKYARKINKLLEGNKDKVFFLGSLNESKMGAFYQFIDLLVVSSVNRTEAFGLVQAEAMMAGKPVVATDLPGVKFLVERTGAGEIAEIKNSGDLKNKIIMVKNNYEKYKNKTVDIGNFLNFNKTVNQYIDLLL